MLLFLLFRSDFTPQIAADVTDGQFVEFSLSEVNQTSLPSILGRSVSRHSYDV